MGHASCIEMGHHLLQRCHAAIVHIGRSERDVAQPGNAEFPVIGRKQGDTRPARIGIRGIETYVGVVEGGEQRWRVASAAIGPAAEEQLPAAHLGLRQCRSIALIFIAVEPRAAAYHGAFKGRQPTRYAERIWRPAISRLEHGSIGGIVGYAHQETRYGKGHLVMGKDGSLRLQLQGGDAAIGIQTGHIRHVGKRRRIAETRATERPDTHLSPIGESHGLQVA